VVTTDTTCRLTLKTLKFVNTVYSVVSCNSQTNNNYMPKQRQPLVCEMEADYGLCEADTEF